MFNIALYNPQIPPNTGNIIRLVANNGCHLHLIEPLGFSLDQKSLRRAGLDYHDLSRVTRHKSFDEFTESLSNKRVFIVSTKGKTRYSDIKFRPSDVILFGSETTGLPPEIFNQIAEKRWLRIPMMENNRSLNLSNSVAIVSYEAWRQAGFANGS